MLENPTSHKLVITGKDVVTVELNLGALCNHTDLRAMHEEADIRIKTNQELTKSI